MALSGLQGLAGLQDLTIDTPEADAEEIQGNAADPRHGTRGETSRPYSWESQQTPGGSHGPYGPPAEGFLDEQSSEYYFLPAEPIGNNPTAETAPWTHAAPQPKNVIGDMSVSPDNVSRQRRMSAMIHRLRTGGQRNVYLHTMEAKQDQWNEIWEVDPGVTMLSEPDNRLKSGLAPGGRGGTDRTQSFAHQNSFGFDSFHMHRRYASGSIPGNFLWMRAGGRPMHKNLAGPSRPPIGPDSPFAGQDVGQAFSTEGAILDGPATEYVAPPEPYVAPARENAYPDSPDWADSYGVF
jgi:hypothetical protein